MTLRNLVSLRHSLPNGAIALAAGALMLLPACTQPEERIGTYEQPTDTDEEVAEGNLEQPDLNVKAGEITGNVEDYVGQIVSVRGEAKALDDSQSFLLQDDQLFGGSEILVINAQIPTSTTDADQSTEDVQVTGEVRQLTLAEMERDYGLTLDPALYGEYEDRPAIIAQSVVLSPDPEEISENPEAYYNQTIAVAGKIANQLSPNTFTLQEDQLFGGNEVLITGATPDSNLEDGEEVVVTGVLRPYVAADFERDYDLAWDLDVQEEIDAEYTNKPVLVTEEIYPSAE